MTNVNCFCTGTTFPNGEATNNRIIMIGKALRLKNSNMTVFINSGGNKNNLNVSLRGVIDGLTFHHLNGSMALGLSRPKRMFNYFVKGFLNSLFVIRRLSREKGNIVYLYSHGSIFNAWISILSRIYDVPVVQEVNEWNEDIDKKPLHAFVYKHIMFRWSKGGIIISENIAHKIEQHKKPNKRFETLMLPVLADKNDWTINTGEIAKTFVWCGLIEGYFKDVVFMMNAFARVHNEHPDYKLIICGKYKPETSMKIATISKALKMPPGTVELTGFISNENLVRYCQTATGLISPLWNDQASIARFPTKIASFLFSGRPVLTCNVGEVGKHLVDGETALFFQPADEEDLSRKIKMLIEYPECGNKIGARGMELAHAKFDFREYARALFDFFNKTLCE